MPRDDHHPLPRSPGKHIKQTNDEKIKQANQSQKKRSASKILQNQNPFPDCRKKNKRKTPDSRSTFRTGEKLIFPINIFFTFYLCQVRSPQLHEVHLVRPLWLPPLRPDKAGPSMQRCSHLLLSKPQSIVSVCSMNVHKRCKELVANTCGVNPRLMADILHDMVTIHKPLSVQITPHPLSPGHECEQVEPAKGEDHREAW